MTINWLFNWGETTMSGQRRAMLLLTIVAAGMLLLPTLGAAYSGILLSTDSGILGSGAWMNPGPTWLEWNVTQNADNSWHYNYLFGHPEGETSHFILEVSPNFTENDIFDETGDFGMIQIDTYVGGPSNPNMPGPIYGIKFDEGCGTVTGFSFNSWRAPMWGDFYAKDGQAPPFSDDEASDSFLAFRETAPPMEDWNTAWNAGFLDPDPIAPIADGAYMGHILVPDTDGPPPPIPEPSTMLLLGSGLLGSIVVLKRRMR